MTPGQIVTYAPGGPLGHILGGCPGIVRERGRGFAVVEFGAILEPCPAEYLAPALLWWRKGRGAWHGPFPGWSESLAETLPPGMAAGLDSPNGAEVVAGGWRWRLVWGGADPPERFD